MYRAQEEMGQKGTALEVSKDKGKEPVLGLGMGRKPFYTWCIPITKALTTFHLSMMQSDSPL